MKRYLLFGGNVYYAGGGWNDYLGDFDTVDAAVASEKASPVTERPAEWWHVVDRESGEVVRRDTDEDGWANL